MTRQPVPSVLLAAPVSDKKDYILMEWLQYISSLTYPNVEVYLVDNSHDPEYHKTIWEKGFRCDYCSPKGKRAPEYVCDSQNMLRDYFLQGGYDYFFSLECDNFPPPNILELMLSIKKDNFNIPYFLKQGDKTTLGVQRPIIDYQGRRSNKVLCTYDSIRLFNGQLQRFYGPSIGCSLFSKRLMQRLKFRVDLSQPFTFSDSFFHLDCNQMGIQPWVHMGVICEHRRFTWKHNPDMLHAVN